MARVGLKGLTYATYASGGDGSAVTYTASSGVAVNDMLISAEVTIDKDDVKLYADNHVVERVNGMIGGTISLELAKLPDTVKTALLGYSASGSVLTVTDAEAPYVGFGYIACEVVSGVKSYLGYWFPKVQFGMDNDSASTKGENTEFKTNTLTGEIMGVVTSANGAVEYYYTDTDSTESGVRTWLNTKAGITG